MFVVLPRFHRRQATTRYGAMRWNLLVALYSRNQSLVTLLVALPLCSTTRSLYRAVTIVSSGNRTLKRNADADTDANVDVDVLRFLLGSIEMKMKSEKLWNMMISSVILQSIWQGVKEFS